MAAQAEALAALEAKHEEEWREFRERAEAQRQGASKKKLKQIEFQLQQEESDLRYRHHEELEELDGKIHEKFEDYLKAAIDICKAVEEDASNGGKDLVESLKTRWSKINSIRKKLRDDPEVFEELRG